MQLIQQSPDIAAYLAADAAIDHEHPRVREVVADLAREAGDAYTYARAAFLYVRDAVPHSADSAIRASPGAPPTSSPPATASATPSPSPSPHCSGPTPFPPGSATSGSPTTTGRTPWSTAWSRSACPGEVAGHGWTPGATGRVSTRGSRWGRSDSRGRHVRTSGKWTTRPCTPHRPRRSSVRSEAPGTARNSGGRFPRGSERTGEPPAYGLTGGSGGEGAREAGQPSSRASAAVGAVPPRWAGTHQVSPASFGRTG